MSPGRRTRRANSRRRWHVRRSHLRAYRSAVSDSSLLWDEARHLARLVCESVGGDISWDVFLREMRFWWDLALEGGPRRRALKRLQRTTAFPRGFA